jgi:leucyl aminopeptidase
LFLNFFVENAYPWIHLDVASTADTPRGQGPHCPANVGTGVPVRALVEFTENFKKWCP